MNKEEKMIEKNIRARVLNLVGIYLNILKLKKKIPSGSEIILLPEFDEGLKKFNLKLGKNMEFKGEKVVYLEIKSIRPKILSRLGNVELVSLSM